MVKNKNYWSREEWKKRLLQTIPFALVLIIFAVYKTCNKNSNLRDTSSTYHYVPPGQASADTNSDIPSGNVDAHQKLFYKEATNRKDSLKKESELINKFISSLKINGKSTEEIADSFIAKNRFQIEIRVIKDLIEKHECWTLEMVKEIFLIVNIQEDIRKVIFEKVGIKFEKVEPHRTH